MNRVRSYENEVVYRIKQLRLRQRVEMIGKINFGQFNYDLYRIIAGADNLLPRKNVLISGTVHGDEEAGCFSILNFLDQLAHQYLDRFRFFCYPCLNPSGFETGMRENMDFIDLNRSFKEPAEPQEVKSVLRSLKEGPLRYHLTVDMHETPPLAISPKEKYLPKDNPPDFYMWETASADSGLRIGDKIIAQLAGEGVPICQWPTIYDDKNSGGVIWYPDGCNNEFYAAGTSLEGYLYSNYTNHSFTTETPTFWSLDRRVHTNIIALRSILDFSLAD